MPLVAIVHRPHSCSDVCSRRQGLSQHPRAVRGRALDPLVGRRHQGLAQRGGRHTAGHIQLGKAVDV